MVSREFDPLEWRHDLVDLSIIGGTNMLQRYNRLIDR